MVCAFAVFLILLGFFTYEVIQDGKNDFPTALFIPAIVIGAPLLISLAYVMGNQLLFFKQKF